MKINEVLDKINKEIMTDEVKNAIVESFNGTVDELVKERVEIEVKSSLENLDETHAKKLEKLLQTIDEDHTKKLEKLVAKIDENHLAKLKNVVVKYEKLLREEAVKFKRDTEESISNYLDLYLDKAIPSDKINEAVKNISAKKTIEKLRQVLAVDDDFVTTQISEAVKDGSQTIDTLRKELNEAMKENIVLSQNLKKANTSIILEKKTQGLPDKKRNYITKLLINKSPEEIEENFDYVVEMFERDEKEENVLITEKAKKNIISKNIDLPKSIINEEVQDSYSSSNENVPVNEYLKALEKIDGKR